MLGTHSSGEKMSQDCSSRVGKNTHFAIPAALAYRQSRFCFKAAVRQRIWIVSGPDLPNLCRICWFQTPIKLHLISRATQVPSIRCVSPCNYIYVNVWTIKVCDFNISTTGCVQQEGELIWCALCLLSSCHSLVPLPPSAFPLAVFEKWRKQSCRRFPI